MRKITAGLLVQLRILALTPVSLVTSYITPLALATVVISLYGRPTGPLVVGAIAASIWNTLLLQSLLIVTQERAWGTMQLLLTTPTGLIAALLGRLVGALVQAAVAIPLTLGLSLAAGATPGLRHLAVTLIAFVEILVGLTAMAMLHMAVIIRYRSYTAFANGIFPVSIVLMGLFVPIAQMPLGINIIGRIFAPAWALDAVREGSWKPLPTAAILAIAPLVAAIWYVAHLRQWMRSEPSAYHV